MYLISPYKKQYKANLHCHSNLSDGKKTPNELKEMYKARGYSILSITDHEAPCNHSELNDEEFLTITGYEAYIRPDMGRYDPYASEIHMNLFARDPKNEALVCYDSRFVKYITEERLAQLSKVGSTEPREYSVAYINRFIQTAQDNGYIVTYNHPVWSMEKEEDILAYEGYFSLELHNYSAHQINGMEYNGSLYDKMLCAGKRVFCHSADDNHNGSPLPEHSDSFGGFTMIMPDDFTYEGIIKAMDKGEMYSSMGPVFHAVSIDGNKLHVECSEVSRITVFVGSKSTQRAIAPIGESITTADFELPDAAKYVRISICDKEGKYADTRGFFRDELEF